MPEKKGAEKSPGERLFRLSNDRVSLEVSINGAFLRTLMIDGQEVIYEPRKDNPRRGGNPILGPTPGSLDERGWGYLYSMPQHGTDRHVEWKLKDQTDTKIALERFTNPKEFLFDGKLIVEFEILKNGARISKTIANFESKPREIGSGFHPYFVTGKIESYVPDAIRALLPLTPGEAEILLPGEKTFSMMINGKVINVDTDPQPLETVVWSDRPDVYICIEPWWAVGGKGVIVGPEESKTYSMVITSA